MTPDAEIPVKPRLWVLTTTFPRWAGDAEPPFVFELSRRLATAFDVTVLAPRAPGAAEVEQLAGVSVRRYPYFFAQLEQIAYGGGILANIRHRPWRLLLVPFLMFGLWRALRAALRADRIDVIHGHWLFPQGWIANLAVRRSRPAVVVTAHGADVFALRGAFWDRVRASVARRAFAVTAVSRAMAERVPDARRIEVIPMGVDLATAFVPSPTTHRADDQLLFVGRLVPKKGVEILLRALALLARRGRKPRLVIAGDGPERARLQSLGEALDLAGQVAWRGPVLNTELPALYREASALVAPFAVAPDGDREGFGLVVVEAMGCECPVITTDLARVNPVVQEDTAWIAPAGEVDALADAIGSVLDQPSEASARARRARDAVLASFDWESISRRYASLLRAACGR